MKPQRPLPPPPQGGLSFPGALTSTRSRRRLARLENTQLHGRLFSYILLKALSDTQSMK